MKTDLIEYIKINKTNEAIDNLNKNHVFAACIGFFIGLLLPLFFLL